MHAYARWTSHLAIWNYFQVGTHTAHGWFSFHVVSCCCLNMAMCIWEILDAFKSGTIFHDKLLSIALLIWKLAAQQSQDNYPPKRTLDFCPPGAEAKSIDLFLFCSLSPWMSLWVVLITVQPFLSSLCWCVCHLVPVALVSCTLQGTHESGWEVQPVLTSSAG